MSALRKIHYEVPGCYDGHFQFFSLQFSRMEAIGVTNNDQLDLNDYRERIELDIRFVPEVDDSLAGVLYNGSIELVAQSLLNEPFGYVQDIQTASLEKKRAYIKSALTVRPPLPLSEEVQRHIDVILQQERSYKNIVSAADLESVRSHYPSGLCIIPEEITLWQGDITELEIDVIVNAANREMLGCFHPFHACIDNAIHSAAGPQLRADCAKIMELQGYSEPTGTAKITRAYHLPSRYVLHTVGPIIEHGHEVEAEHRTQLASCYSACLTLAAQMESIRSIAFCGISTGVFGYPKEEAANIAVAEVVGWIKKHPGRFDQIVFNVFSEEDRTVYDKIFGAQ
jgi:O-acetyl-ADP-ribose deacetylase (regulator of RNase III)